MARSNPLPRLCSRCNRVIIGSETDHDVLFHDIKSFVFRCNICELDSVTSDGLALHYSIKHDLVSDDISVYRTRIDPPYTALLNCSYCNFQSAERQRLRHHVDIAHRELTERIYAEVARFVSQQPWLRDSDFHIARTVEVTTSSPTSVSTLSVASTSPIVSPVVTPMITQESTSGSTDAGFVSPPTAPSVTSPSTSAQSIPVVLPAVLGQEIPTVNGVNASASDGEAVADDIPVVYIAGQAIDASSPSVGHEVDLSSSEEEVPELESIPDINPDLFPADPSVSREMPYLGGYLVCLRIDPALIRHTIRFAYIPPSGMYTVHHKGVNDNICRALVHLGTEPSNPATIARVEAFQYAFGKQYAFDCEFTHNLEAGQYELEHDVVAGYRIPFTVDYGWRTRDITQQI